MNRNPSQEKLTFKKKIFFSIITLSFSLIIIFILGEIIVRVFNPQVIQYPRTNYSENYGLMWPANAQIINERPGHWKFIYNTNKFNYRGDAVDISNSYNKVNIVVLGDSYSFGQGVNDGEEFASIINNKLKNNFNVINLGGSGWGLTQEIRRFYEFGQLYHPQIIILQFDITDPKDNFNYKITEIENNRFIFNNNIHKSSFFKLYLSNSILQKSCLYNLFRVSLRRHFISESSNHNAQKENKALPEEKFYIELLNLFCKDIEMRGIKFFIISVNKKLERFPYINKGIKKLEEQNMLEYIEVNNWFEITDEFTSPEGHLWGKEAHRIIGEKLSEIIQENFANSTHQNTKK